MEFWFRTEDPEAGLYAVADQNLGAGGHDRHLFLTGGNLKVRTWNTEIIQTEGLNLADGQWHHVAHTLGRKAKGQQLFVDGKLAAQGTKTASNFNWQKHINIGACKNGITKKELSKRELRRPQGGTHSRGVHSGVSNEVPRCPKSEAAVTSKLVLQRRWWASVAENGAAQQQKNNQHRSLPEMGYQMSCPSRSCGGCNGASNPGVRKVGY